MHRGLALALLACACGTNHAPGPGDAAPTAGPPATVTDGGALAGMTFEDCAKDGPPVVERWSQDVISAMAVAPDGSLYVVMAKGTELRHYQAAAGAKCQLTLDATIAGKAISAIAVDSQSRLLIADDRTITRYIAGKAATSCAFSGTPDRFVVLPDDTLLVRTGRNELTVVAVDGCQRTPWTPELAFYQLGPFYRVGDHLLILSTPSHENQRFQAAVVALDGTFEYAIETDPGRDPLQILCTSVGAIACGTGVCIADDNCRVLRSYGPDGKALTNRWIAHLRSLAGWAGASPGVSYLGLTVSDDQTPPQYRAEIMRVGGL